VAPARRQGFGARVRDASGLLLIVALACAPEQRPHRPAPGSGSILIGEFQALSGPGSERGLAFHRGLLLALDEQNARGGIDGRLLEVQTLDDRGRTAESALAMRRLVTEARVVAVVGGSSLPAVEAAASEAQGVPFLAPFGTGLREEHGHALWIGLAAGDPPPSLDAAFVVGYRAAHGGELPGADEAVGYDCGLSLCAGMLRARTFDAGDLWRALLARDSGRGARGVR
jgi:hypothetical protein